MAAIRVFDIAELLEMVLDKMDERTLLLSQGISKIFAITIASSPKYQRKLFFTNDAPTRGEAYAKVNPLLVQLTCSPLSEISGWDRVNIIFDLLDPPIVSDRTYHLKYPHGSWRRMYMLRDTKYPLLEVSIPYSPKVGSVFLNKKMYQDPQPDQPPPVCSWSLREVTDDRTVQQRFKFDGLVQHVDVLSARIMAGDLDPAALADGKQWAAALFDEIKSPQDAECCIEVKSKCSHVHAHFQDKLRAFAWPSMIEAMEGRAGQHFKESEDMVQLIKSRPSLLGISDDKHRIKMWRVACFGYA